MYEVFALTFWPSDVVEVCWGNLIYLWKTVKNKFQHVEKNLLLWDDFCCADSRTYHYISTVQYSTDADDPKDACVLSVRWCVAGAFCPMHTQASPSKDAPKLNLKGNHCLKKWLKPWSFVCSLLLICHIDATRCCKAHCHMRLADSRLSSVPTTHGRCSLSPTEEDAKPIMRQSAADVKPAGRSRLASYSGWLNDGRKSMCNALFASGPQRTQALTLCVTAECCAMLPYSHRLMWTFSLRWVGVKVV